MREAPETRLYKARHTISLWSFWNWIEPQLKHGMTCDQDMCESFKAGYCMWIQWLSAKCLLYFIWKFIPFILRSLLLWIYEIIGSYQSKHSKTYHNGKETSRKEYYRKKNKAIEENLPWWHDWHQTPHTELHLLASTKIILWKDILIKKVVFGAKLARYWKHSLART